MSSTDAQKEFFLELCNRFSCLKIEETEDNEEEETDRRTEVDSNIEQYWKSVKEAFNETANNVLGFFKNRERVKVGSAPKVGKKLKKEEN